MTHPPRLQFELVKDQMRPGDIVVFDPLGRPVRIVRTLTSWAATAYHLTEIGTFERVA